MRKTLEQYENEAGEDGEPFELELPAGKVVAFRRPQDMPFKELVNFDTSKPTEVLRVLMGDEAFTDLTESPRVTLGVLSGILADYMSHYGLPTPGEADASPRLSSGSARPSKRTSGRQRAAQAS